MRVTTARWTSAVACIAALLSIAAAALAPTTAHAQSGPFVFVPHANDNVARIDVPTGTLVPGTIGVGAGALSAAVRGDQSLVYVTNLNSNSVSVIETATNTVVATIAVGSRPFGVAVSPDGTRVYVTNEGSNSTSVIDTATNTVVATIPTGSFSRGVAVSPDGTQVYVTNFNSNNVSVIDTATNTVLTTFNVVPVLFRLPSSLTAAARMWRISVPTRYRSSTPPPTPWSQR